MRTFFQRSILPFAIAIAYAGTAAAGFCDTKGEGCQVEAATYTPTSGVPAGQRIVYPDFATLDLKPYVDANPTMPIDFFFDLGSINLRTTPTGTAASVTVFELGMRSVNDDGSGSNTDFRVLAMKVALSPTGKPDQLSFLWRDYQVDWAARGPDTAASAAESVIEAVPLAATTSLVRVTITPGDHTWAAVNFNVVAVDGDSVGTELVPYWAGFKMPQEVTPAPGTSGQNRVNRPAFLRAGILGGALQRAGMRTIFGFMEPDVVEETTAPIDGVEQ